MINRQRVFAFGLMLLATVALTSSSNAQGTTPGFLPGNSGSAAVNPLPDFIPGISNAANTTVSTVTITNADINSSNNGLITGAFFTIEGLTHSHISDLTIRLRHTAANGVERVATLFERVGITDTSGNGFIDNQNLDGTGDSSNVEGTYRFQDGGSSLWTAAANTGDGGVVPTLNNATNSPLYSASGASNNAVSLNNAFGVGNLQLPSVVGTWDFEISDRSNQTTNADVGGVVQSFTRVNVGFNTAVPTGVPEPASAAGMLLALVGLAARRRRA